VLVCFDSSALVKLLVDEEGSEAVVRLWDAADAVIASRLVVPEVRAALEAATRASRLRPVQLRQALDAWRDYAAALRMVEVTATLAQSAAELTGRLVLGGADAVHLASALALSDGRPVLAAFDSRLRAAGLAVGLRLAPADR
jgi:predicted nucleic acid-binding protein